MRIVFLSLFWIILISVIDYFFTLLASESFVEISKLINNANLKMIPFIQENNFTITLIVVFALILKVIYNYKFKSF